jgi:hypothetical protein
MKLDVLTGKHSIRLWIAGLVASSTLLSGQQPSIPPPDKDPFVGQWKASPAKSRPQLGKEGGSYETTIKREGDYLVYSSSQWLAAHSGLPSKVQKWQYKLLCDGRSRSLPTHVFTSCVYVAPNRVEGETETRDPNQPTFFWTREVSPDGQETMIFNYEDKKRTRLHSVEVLDRVK